MKKEIYAIGATVLLLIIAASGCLEIPISGSKTIYVNDGGGADYVKIQDAIDNASGGDTIFVYNGTYNERLIINKSINLIGASRDKTVIECQKSNASREDHVVLIDADNCTINNFKIIGADDSSYILGININTSSNTISNNIILDNYKGVYLNRDAKNNNVSRNTIANNTYAIYVFVSYHNIIFGNTILNNYNGIRVINSKYNRVYNNSVIMNQQGIVVCCGSENNMIYFNTFKQNSEWNAHDELFNQWYYGSVGNYWDDYNGADADGNGIGDVPYNIPNKKGGSNTKDRFPLMNPVDV